MALRNTWEVFGATIQEAVHTHDVRTGMSYIYVEMAPGSVDHIEIFALAACALFFRLISLYKGMLRCSDCAPRHSG